MKKEWPTGPPARMPPRASARFPSGCPCPANPHRPRAARRHTPAVPAAPGPRPAAALRRAGRPERRRLGCAGPARLQGAVPASALAPTLPGRRLVGQAVTVRNVPRADSVAAAAASGKGMMGEHEAYNLAEPGDVVVIEGLPGVSNLGGQSAAVASRSGCAGAIVDGGHRDPDASRELGFPIWSRGPTPITGKWRLRGRDQRHGPYREYAGPGRRPGRGRRRRRGLRTPCPGAGGAGSRRARARRRRAPEGRHRARRRPPRWPPPASSPDFQPFPSAMNPDIQCVVQSADILGEVPLV